MKKILKLIPLLFLLMAFAEAGGFTRSVDSNSLVWNKYPSSSRKIEWKGGKDADGYASGRGVVIFSNKGSVSASYMGNMRRGKMDGEAIAIYPKTAMCYVGQLSDWSENGHGTMVFADGSTYQGRWLDGNRHGTGTQWSSSGSLMYQGQFQNDRPLSESRDLNRLSAMFSPTSGIYKKYKSSDLKWFGVRNNSGDASGYGVVISRDNEGNIAGIYHGFAIEGRMNSDVVAIYTKVIQAYVGSINNWSENGEGQMFYSDGTSYVGGWFESSREGPGTLYSADGKIIQHGHFSKDLLAKSFSSDSSLTADSAIQPTQSKPQWELQNWEERQPRVNQANIDQAWQNIAAILFAQKVLDWAVDSESDELGALFALYTKYYARAPGIDNNLRIIYPGVHESGISLMRNLLCALVDGTFTLENLTERSLKSELISAAKREGASEGQAVKAAAFTYDALVKVSKIQKARQ